MYSDPDAFVLKCYLSAGMRCLEQLDSCNLERDVRFTVSARNIQRSRGDHVYALDDADELSLVYGVSVKLLDIVISFTVK